MSGDSSDFYTILEHIGVVWRKRTIQHPVRTDGNSALMECRLDYMVTNHESDGNNRA